MVCLLLWASYLSSLSQFPSGKTGKQFLVRTVNIGRLEWDHVCEYLLRNTYEQHLLPDPINPSRGAMALNPTAPA